MTPLTEAAPASPEAAPPVDARPPVDAATPDAPDRPSPVVATVAVIADPGWWSQELVQFLGDEGFAVLTDPTGESADDHRRRRADVAVIDFRLAARAASGVCVAWRQRCDAPVLAIAGSSDETTVLAAFAAGADHVVLQSATCRQIVAHLRSLLRRVPRRRLASEVSLASSPVQLGDDGRSALVRGRTVPLTEEEFQMLSLLLGRPGRVVTRAELGNCVRYASGSARAVDLFVRRLREKLEEVDTCRRIAVVRGVGFRFEIDSSVEDRSLAEGSVVEPDGDR